MPSTTERQAHYMAARAHGWNPGGKQVPISVAKEFHAADKKVGKWEHAPMAKGNKQSSDHMNGYPGTDAGGNL
jgi:hypothetical protein